MTRPGAQVISAATDPAEIARHQLLTGGVCVMAPAQLRRSLGADDDAWRRFTAHWDELAPDRYAAELGTRRLRRYGHFSFVPAQGIAKLLPHRTFLQPDDSNPLYVEKDRHFEPLTPTFAEDPLLYALLRLLGRVATALDSADNWSAKVTPFRVLASSGDKGEPTPEGLHRDGVTLVTSLLIARRNAEGGQSVVCDPQGRRLVTITLAAPGSLLLGDDRRTMHGVSPIRPRDPARPAQRDVLVITFAPRQSPPR
ncbi:MAG: 2OG-Fe dioxygenase family protein [Mycobacteriaceae bacterium]|nr:2OG-Fe dioxygenase family protein [Mycobacteriaceae bacterium]